MIKAIAIIISTCIALGILANIIVFWWAIRNYFKNEMRDNNIPSGINDPGDYEEPKYRTCPYCKRIKDEEMFCEDCNDIGKIEISFEEIVEERERKIENKSNL